MSKRYLLDLNALIALTDDEHLHHNKAQEWFHSRGTAQWALCPLTEAGFVRFTTNPATGPVLRTFEEATAILEALSGQPGYCYWPISDSWVSLTAAFTARVFGHQQVTDAFLLGLAIKGDGVLVTFDRGLRYLAGSEFSRNLLVLE